MEYSKLDILKTMLISVVANILFILMFLLQKPQGGMEEIKIPSADNSSVCVDEKEILLEPENISETLNQENGIVAKEVIESEKEKADYIKEADREKFDFVSGFIVGNYKINSRMHYNFGVKGQYTGFFDSANPNIRQGSYEISVRDGIVLLYIYNNDKSAVVTYQIHIQDTSKLVLYYEGLDLKITLKK